MTTIRRRARTPHLKVFSMLQRALLRDAASGVWLDFRQPEEVLVARSNEQALAVLQRLEAHGRQGGYAAGYLSYEAAPAMDAAYQSFPAADGVPLAVFGLCNSTACCSPGWT